MSEAIDEEAKAKLNEFNMEFEFLVASMLRAVPLSAIKKFYGSDTMDLIVAKVLKPAMARRR